LIDFVGRRTPLVTLVVTAVVLMVAAIAPEPSHAFDALVLDRERPRAWTLVTAHVLHTDPAHVGWNIVALLCLGILAEPLGRVRFVASLVVGIVAVDVWFVFVDQSLRFYCGLSGALNAVLLATLYALRESVPAKWLFAIAAIAMAKAGWEWHTGAALLTHTRWPAAVGAHVAGLVGGAAWIALIALRDRGARM